MFVLNDDPDGRSGIKDITAIIIVLDESYRN